MRHLAFCGAIPLVVAAVFLHVSAGSSYAADCTWQHDPSTAGDWLDPSNWDPSAPGLLDRALIDNGGTASIAVGSVRVAGVIAGGSFTGSVLHTGGTNVVGGTVFLGRDSGADGAYALTGGSLASKVQNVGYGGQGLFANPAGSTRWQVLWWWDGMTGRPGPTLSAADRLHRRPST